MNWKKRSGNGIHVSGPRQLDPRILGALSLLGIHHRPNWLQSPRMSPKLPSQKLVIWISVIPPSSIFGSNRVLR